MNDIEKKGTFMMQIHWRTFLLDVFICSLGAYGGPEAHYGVITDQMITKKKYFTEEELIELIALTGILPGPSSTQTIVAIGQKVGGPLLGMLTMVVWALPVLIIMTALSFLSVFLERANISNENLRFIGPMAVGFIAVAGFRIGRKVVKDRFTLILMSASAIITFFIRTPWIYPLLLLIGGALAVLRSDEKNIWNRTKLNPPWKPFLFFLFFALGSLLLAGVTHNLFVQLFEKFYRYGYLVIGGGQVVVPLMFSELVEINHFMTGQEFLTGFGIVQGMPGPMFSFAAYAGGMAARGHSILYQIFGAMIGGIGIFLPGLLLIFFVYPIWEQLKAIRGIKISLSGITAVAGGFIVAAAVLLFIQNGFVPVSIAVTVLSFLLLYSKKVPAPIIVSLSIILGFIM